jgi:Raf kinase inhibitor-like YbhB/YbcL family protein
MAGGLDPTTLRAGGGRMRLSSHSWMNGDRIPSRFAAGRLDEAGNIDFSENLNPDLSWSDLPSGTRSLALICHDFDGPIRRSGVDRTSREVPADLPRTDFFHWVLIDLPATPAGIAEGEFSRGFTRGGKPGPETLRGARHGLNDCTGWFADDPGLAGRYFGYDGPFPPDNDALVHHYVFTLYAVSVRRLPVEGLFTGVDVRQALSRCTLATATLSGTYSLNRHLARC